MGHSGLARVALNLSWEHTGIRYRDTTVANRIDFRRDLFPGDLGVKLQSSEPGILYSEPLVRGQRLPGYDTGLVRWIHRRHFRRRFGRASIEPVIGRFYPRGVIAEAVGGSAEDSTPFRLLDTDAAHYQVDLNHPLAGYDLTVSAQVIALRSGRKERNDRYHDVVELASARGPGMQVPLDRPGYNTIPEAPLSRMDTREDALFYRQPRMVQHIDSVAIDQVKSLHARLLQPGMQVLDLMSSWTSHLPPSLTGLQVSGLGMNAEELAANPALSDRIVRDINATPALPYGDEQFDAVICAMSVEYLIRPLEVFREVARVLRPGGIFVNTFSERWFPTKVVEVWTELHPYERLGRVIEYYRQSGGFTGIHAESIRGHLRPQDDEYAGIMALSDPVYAVWGRKDPPPSSM